MQNLKSIVNSELECQLRASLSECRSLKQDNIKLNQLNAELKQQLIMNKNSEELEHNLKQSLLENKELRKELSFYQDFVKSQGEAQKPTYNQVEQELNDLQEFFKKYYALQENLLNLVPIQLLKECWQAINQTFKSHFNTFQSVQSLQDEVSILEQDYKLILHSNQSDSDLSYICKQQLITEKRVEIERCRKEIQMKQSTMKQLDQELDELQKEFTYICKTEQRRFNQQLEMEKQLITLRQRTDQPIVLEQKMSMATIQRSRQHSDYFKGHQVSVDSQQSFKPPIGRVLKTMNEQENEKSNLEKTIDQTRKKLSRQLSQASNMRESRK